MSSTARAKIFKTKQIEQMLYRFLWNNGPDKVKRNIIIAPKEYGGLNMVHISAQAKALKIAWIKRFLEGDRDCGWR